MTTDIIGMGAALVDMLAEVGPSFLELHALEKGHMHLIDAARAAAIVSQLPSATRVSGGSAANTCVGYALFGGNAAFLGRVADDELGSAFTDSIRMAGVRYTNLAGISDAGTGYCSSLITSDGERTMCTYLGASGDFDQTAVRPEFLQDARLLYLEGYIWDTPGRAAAADAAITAIKQRGGQVGFTLSDGWVVDKHHATFMHYLQASKVDVLFANESEIMALTKADSFDGAATAARQLAPTVVLTQSEQGALILQGDTAVRVAPVPVTRVVDATGAGDLFAAGFLYGYLNHMPLASAGRLGAAAASEVISHIGARPQKDVRGFLAA